MDIEDIAATVAPAAPAAPAATTTTTAAPSNTQRIARLIAADLAKSPPFDYSDPVALSRTIQSLARKYKCILAKRLIGTAYKELHESDPAAYPMIDGLRQALVKRAGRSASGIINISVVMPPDTFSCKYNCKFCPNETIANGARLDMPRSYLSNEDAIARAARSDFDAVHQTHARFSTLEANGHVVDKIEFRVLGGTFSCYNHDVAAAFVRDLYYAANTYDAESPRVRGSLADEQAANLTATIHVVGLGVETRPDEICADEIIRFRRYGVTRVEIGVQHTDDVLLRRVNRGHGVKASRAAIKLLKDYGFKVEIHIMTDLPGATPEGDKACYDEVLCGSDLMPDYMKDYPCMDVSFTEIKAWRADGRWTPYAERDGGSALQDVLIYRQKITPPWVRVNRIQRDFRPAAVVSDGLGYSSDTHNGNLGDVVKRMAEARGVYCQCIRCCELRGEPFRAEDVVYTTHVFTASGAQEYFVSATVPRPHRPLLLGFIRLRISDALQQSILPELRGATAMIRELHVYGAVKPVGVCGAVGSAQHLGIGKILLEKAERMARTHECAQIAVISGIGVRNYYRKQGY